MNRKARTLLSFVNTVINAVQLGVAGKKALESDTGKKITEKTNTAVKTMVKTGTEKGKIICNQMKKTISEINDMVNEKANKNDKQN